jgi:putative tryptophan/tyrosine transport system substrate-binding protein
MSSTPAPISSSTQHLKRLLNSALPRSRWPPIRSSIRAGDKLVALPARHAVPTMYHFREFAAAGGLMSYRIDSLETYRQVGVYAGQILKGAKPADLPVLQPSKFEFVINLKAAKALGVKFSDNLLSLADAVID